MERPVNKADVEYLIERVEWSMRGMCPLCRSTEREGHSAHGCLIASTKKQLEKFGVAS